jgi:flagellar assembly protein FliH
MSKILKAGVGAPVPDHSPAAPPSAAIAAGKVLEREVVLAHEGARRIVEAAREEAQAILAAARTEAEAIRAEAEAAGEAAGLARWEERAGELTRAEGRLLEEARGQLLQLALRIAEKVLRQRLEMAPDAILPMVEEALQAARGHVAGRVVLRLHPLDAATVTPQLERLRQQNRGFESLEVLRDASLSRGGCRVETQFGTIDASIETQLRAIESLLRRGASP